MKKIPILLVSFALVLAGCESNTYKQDKANGVKFLSEKKYDDAIQSFSDMVKQDQKSTEAQQLLQNAYSQKYDYYETLGDTAAKKGDFATAIKNDTVALQAEPDNKDGQKALDQAKKLKPMQENLDQYSKWLNGIVKSGMQISTNWEKASEAASLGTMSLNDLMTVAQQNVSALDSLSKSVSDKTLDQQIDPSVHDHLRKLTSDLHQSFIDVGNAASADNAAVSDVVTAGQNIEQFSDNLLNYQNEVKDYAKKNSLIYHP